MKVHYLLDFTQGDPISIRICAIHGYEIDPIDIDSKYVHAAVISDTKNGDMVTFWEWKNKRRINIGERKVKGYIDLPRVKKIDMSKL
jgi:hypothetical protein